MNSGKPALSGSTAILLGSVMISISILISGGVITTGKGVVKGAKTDAPQVTQAVKQQQPPAVTLDQVKEVFNKSLIKFGDTNKKLVVIEASDTSCPYCHIAAGKNPELNKQVGSRFTLVSDGGDYIAPVPEIEKLVKAGSTAFAYIYFPGHGNGEMGAKALYCAYENNKFWEVHNLLMSSKGYDLLNNSVKNDKSKSGELADFLQPVFDSATMKKCLGSDKYDSRLKDDVTLGQSLNISGTPGFYLNAAQYAGAYSYKDMETTVNSAIK